VRPIRTSVRLDNKVREVRIEQKNGLISALVDGRKYELSIYESRPGVYSIVPANPGGSSTEAVVREVDGCFRVRVSDRIFEASIEGPGCGRKTVERDGGKGARVLKAQMPGRVVRVLVEEGAQVKRGQGILVLEAMKMENEIGAPRDGTVKEIKVSADDRVETGAALAVIE
jgi:biotin carboxyl carrier protein